MGVGSLCLKRVAVPQWQGKAWSSPSCIFSHPHLAVHLCQELVQKFLPVLLLSTHLGHQLLHHVVELLCGGIKLDPAYFGCQSTLVGFLRERTARGGNVPPAVMSQAGFTSPALPTPTPPPHPPPPPH